MDAPDDALGSTDWKISAPEAAWVTCLQRRSLKVWDSDVRPADLPAPDSAQGWVCPR